MAVALVSLGPVSASFSPSFGQSTTAGDLLVAWLASNSGSATNPFTTSSGGWTIIPGDPGTYGGYAWTAVAYKANCAAGETAPVFSDGVTGTAIYSQLGEFSGAATSNVLDQSGTGSGDEIQTAACTAPDTQSGDLIVSGAYWNSPGGAATASVTLTGGTGAAVTPNTTTGQPGGAGTTVYAFTWGVAGAAGADDDTAVGTLSAFAGSGSVIASFKAGSAPGPSLAPFYPAVQAIRREEPAEPPRRFL